MNNVQYFGLQASVWLVGSAAANSIVGKIGFLFLGLLYVVLQFLALRDKS
jgi:hypothetical protein